MAHSEALEKRLRAVYDAFDQRNHKVCWQHYSPATKGLVYCRC
jgi:hypothetical protein